MTGIKVSELWHYPIKGCAGEQLKWVNIDTRGFNLDRRWMVVDENGMFVVQRGQGSRGIGIKSMSLISVRTKGQAHVTVTARHMPQLVFPLVAPQKDHCDVQVWDWHGKGIEVGRACSDWFTEYLSRERPGKYRLVQIAEDVPRFSKLGPSQLSFADGYPLLVISQASHDEVNRRIVGEPVPMNRYRPNIVISGCEPHAEDTINYLRIEGVVLKGWALCERCAVIGYDQATAKVDPRPLRALAQYRQQTDDAGKTKVYLGRNFTHHGTGIIVQNSEVEVL